MSGLSASLKVPGATSMPPTAPLGAKRMRQGATEESSETTGHDWDEASKRPIQQMSTGIRMNRV